MGLIDQVFTSTAATGYATSKLSGVARNITELGLNLYAQNRNKIGNYKPPRGVHSGKVGRTPLTMASARHDPLLGIDWYCDLPKFPGAASLYWEHVEEAALPMMDFEPQSNFRAGKMYHYPSHQNLGNLTLKLYEDSRGSATTYIRQWQSLMFDAETGLYNVPKVYKQNIVFTLYDVAKYDTMIVTYSGCWPSNVDQFSLVGGASDRIVVGATFSVDSVIIQFPQTEAIVAERKMSLTIRPLVVVSGGDGSP